MILRKYLAGTRYVTSCTTFGMFSIGKIMPESSIDGSIVVSSASCMASWLDLAMVEKNSPMLSAPARKMRGTEKHQNIVAFDGHVEPVLPYYRHEYHVPESYYNVWKYLPDHQFVLADGACDQRFHGPLLFFRN